MSKKVALPIPRTCMMRPATDTHSPDPASAPSRSSDSRHPTASAVVWVLSTLWGYGSTPLALKRARLSRRALISWLSGSGTAPAPYSIFRILRLITPAGVSMSTSSPILRPMRERPTGDSRDIFPSNGAASALPTTL